MPNFFSGIKDNSEIPIYKYFCDGEWMTSKSGKTITIFSPITDEPLGKIQSLTKEEIDEAIEAAYWAQLAWQKVPLDKRARILHLAADWLRENPSTEFSSSTVERLGTSLTNLLTLEIGKTMVDAEDEVLRTADLIDYFAEEGRNLRGETLESDSFPGYEKGKTAIIQRVPVGVILSISPFNYPINLSASKIAPALMMGNAVIVKPATQGCLSTLHLVEIFRKAGLPAGILNVVSGIGNEIGDYLVTHPKIKMICFTGSTMVGDKIAKKTAMIPLLFECGGNNPAIVLDDADYELAAKEIIKGAYAFSGQRCTAVKYVLATNEVMDFLRARLYTATEELVKMGDPREKETKMVGPLINKDAAETVENRIIKARVAGAEIVCGGKRAETRHAEFSSASPPREILKQVQDDKEHTSHNSKNNSLYFEPTILDHVQPYFEIVKVETFGPVLSLVRVKNINEAVNIINSSLYGLQACIFTKDEGTAIKLGSRLNVGTVQINSKPQRGPDHFPFLGIKGSGVGVQGVRYTLEAMTRLKSVVLNKPE